jgi:hypothetical protein
MEHSHSARHGVRWSRWVTAMGALCAASAIQAEGLLLRPPENSISDHSPSEYALAHMRNSANSIHLFGDYYFFDPATSTLGPAMSSLLGGFRASTGVVGLGRPASLFDFQREDTQNLPYVGLGYSHLWFTGQLSLNADFGLASQSASNMNHARGLFNGSQSLDDVTGELRWAPVMAVNVRYSF